MKQSSKRDELAETARGLFQEKGILATGIDTILAEWVNGKDFRGCILFNAVAECRSPAPRIQGFVLELRQGRRLFLESLAATACATAALLIRDATARPKRRPTKSA